MKLLTIAAGGSLHSGCTSSQGGTMKPSESAAALRNYLAQYGLSELQLRVPQLVEGMLGFYRTVRAYGVERVGGDMLLFQWGVVDWGDWVGVSSILYRRYFFVR
ncbi:MAG: hypothetical protein ACKVQA_16210 [Burkholderiales bacterium]